MILMRPPEISERDARSALYVLIAMFLLPVLLALVLLSKCYSSNEKFSLILCSNQHFGNCKFARKGEKLFQDEVN
jgi:hypothetical protein